MPKIIELTFELNVNKVSCPGVWLCQDGLVSLTVFALGTSYQTCMMTPVFPLIFKDVFYFRKRFQESCTLSNIFCLLKDETIYCELVQWCGSCSGNGQCTILAQYLGALNDVLFPPNLCSNEGVDLLMRRSRGFPGILAPKIEISTKVRIDEVYDQLNILPPYQPRIKPCVCRKPTVDPTRQKQVCHTPMYHRCRHGDKKRPRSAHSGSCCSLVPKKPEFNLNCMTQNQCTKSQSRSSLSTMPKRRCRDYQKYQVFQVATPKVETAWQTAASYCSSAVNSELELPLSPSSKDVLSVNSSQRLLLESQFVEPEPCHHEPTKEVKIPTVNHVAPCFCEICKRYYELFHAKD